MTPRTVFAAGSAGYIGSRLSAAPVEAGRNIVVIDSLTSSSPVKLQRIVAINTPEVQTNKSAVADWS